MRISDLSPAIYPVPQNPMLVPVGRQGLNGLGAIDLSLGGSAFGGVPNWAIYAALALVAYQALFGGHTKRRSRKEIFA